LSCVARHGDPSKVPAWIKNAMSTRHPNMNEVANHFAASSLANRYLVQTSKAATIFHAGVKVNLLLLSRKITDPHF